MERNTGEKMKKFMILEILVYDMFWNDLVSCRGGEILDHDPY